ncbi:MAG: hypothetical protein DRN57_05730 [Thermoplasmata archaeon]|nr:MAG: hypothetical protein DRN57_05730 [Thermoplasmata archaeon]
MDILLIMYLVIGIASFIVLVVMMLMGGLDLDIDVGSDIDIDIDAGDIDLDAGGGGPGFISIPIILSFTSAFGGLGAILTYFGVDPVLTPFISAFSALVFASLLFLAVRYFFKIFSSDSTVNYGSLVGKKATVTVPINPGMEGQVALFTEQRGRTLVPAIGDRKFSNNAEVVISRTMGDTVKVVPPSEWKRKGSNSSRKRSLSRPDKEEKKR